MAQRIATIVTRAPPPNGPHSDGIQKIVHPQLPSGNDCYIAIEAMTQSK